MDGEESPVVDTCIHAKSLLSCRTLFDPIECSIAGSSVHGILQARILEWVAMTSRGSSLHRNGTSNAYIACIGRGFFSSSATYR